MRRVRREELLDLPMYERSRAEIRAGILEAKRVRRVHVAGVLTLLFENAATIRYQVQEMVRRLFSLKEIPKPDDAADALAIAYCAGVSAPPG